MRSIARIASLTFATTLFFSSAASLANEEKESTPETQAPSVEEQQQPQGHQCPHSGHKTHHPDSGGEDDEKHPDEGHQH